MKKKNRKCVETVQGDKEWPQQSQRKNSPPPRSCAWDCERLQGSGRRRRAEERIEVAPLSPLRQCIPIHHGGSALLSCSSTSREGWEAPILSWQPSAAHSQSHIITTFIFISIDTRPFPPLKLNQRGCRKGREGRAGTGREGGRGGEVGGVGWWWNAGPGHSSLHSNLHANGFVWEQGLYHEEWAGAEAEKQLQSADQGHDAASRHESPRRQQDPDTNPHRENKKIIISCIYELTWCKGYAHVDYFTVINDSVPIRGSISTGSWYCWSCTAELWWPDREEDGLD